MTEPLSDQQLLQAYAAEKSDDTFRAIVDRHARWIFAAAFRQLGDRQMAEDAVQIVFVLLARRSRKMPTHQKLSGWLFNTLGYTVKNLRRASRRRQMHEQLAALERSNVTEPSPQVDDLETHLDAAVASLGQADRSAIVLRFYQDRSFGEIAETLGITEIAARKRVSRGTEKLRKRFEKWERDRGRTPPLYPWRRSAASNTRRRPWSSRSPTSRWPPKPALRFPQRSSPQRKERHI